MSVRAERKRVTREQLKRSGYECFARHGIDGTSIGRLTRHAGVAHGTFYVHFESKERLLDDLLGDFNRRLAEALAPMWDGERGFPDRETLAAIANAFLTHWESEREFVAAYSGYAGARLGLNELRDGINPPAVTLLTGWLEGVFPTVSAAQRMLAGQAILAMWMRVGLNALFSDEVTREDAVRTLVGLSRGGLLELQAMGS